jgi:hypothetical protein
MDLESALDEQSAQAALDAMAPPKPADWVASKLDVAVRRLRDEAVVIRHGKTGAKSGADAFRRSAASVLEDCARQVEAEAAAIRAELAERGEG